MHSNADVSLDRLFALSEAFKYTAWPPVQFVCDIKHLVPLNPTPEELAEARERIFSSSVK